MLAKERSESERAIAAAGGLLLAGEDPTGMDSVLAGFGDQRELELLVETGFTPLEAIEIATKNGAQYLGDTDPVGTIAAGKQADLVVIRGDPSQKIEDIEQTEIVFKDGIGYDSPTDLRQPCSSRGLEEGSGRWPSKIVSTMIASSWTS